jgi:hypothetical protein
MCAKALLREHQDLPGVILSSQPLKFTRVTSRGTEINQEDEIGASISIPRNAVDRDMDIGLAASFSGSHEVPADMEPVSPAYVVTANREVVLSREATLRMQHTASIESSSDVVLLEADATSGQSHTVMKRSSNVVEQGTGKHHFGLVKIKNIATTVFRLVVPKRSERMYNYVV